MSLCRLPYRNLCATIRRMIDDKNDTVDHMNPNNIVVVVTFELWRHTGIPSYGHQDNDDVVVTVVVKEDDDELSY